MPRKPVQSKKRGSRTLTDDQVFELIIGCGGEKSYFEDEEQKRNAWDYHKQRLLSRSFPPGRRPEIWWKYDAPEPKRTIGVKNKNYRYDFSPWDSGNFLPLEEHLIYEDDLTYLQRLNLLEKWEINQLKKQEKL